MPPSISLKAAVTPEEKSLSMRKTIKLIKYSYCKDLSGALIIISCYASSWWESVKCVSPVFSWEMITAQSIKESVKVDLA